MRESLDRGFSEVTSTSQMCLPEEVSWPGGNGACKFTDILLINERTCNEESKELARYLVSSVFYAVT